MEIFKTMAGVLGLAAKSIVHVEEEEEKNSSEPKIEKPEIINTPVLPKENPKPNKSPPDSFSKEKWT